MRADDLEQHLQQAKRHTLIRVIRGHPDWTLEQLLHHLDGKHGPTMRELTVLEIANSKLSGIIIPSDGGPPIDLQMRDQAEGAEGEEFFEFLREVLLAAPHAVGASYLRARLGGPRWKLQGALRKLEARGEVTREGKTSDTVYTYVEAAKPKTRRRRSKAAA